MVQAQRRARAGAQRVGDPSHRVVRHIRARPDVNLDLIGTGPAGVGPGEVPVGAVVLRDLPSAARRLYPEAPLRGSAEAYRTKERHLGARRLKRGDAGADGSLAARGEVAGQSRPQLRGAAAIVEVPDPDSANPSRVD